MARTRKKSRGKLDTLTSSVVNISNLAAGQTLVYGDNVWTNGYPTGVGSYEVTTAGFTTGNYPEYDSTGTFLAKTPVPAISQLIYPDSTGVVRAGGSQTMQITGTGLDSVTEIYIGSTSITFTKTSTLITFQTPPLAAATNYFIFLNTANYKFLVPTMLNVDNPVTITSSSTWPNTLLFSTTYTNTFNTSGGSFPITSLSITGTYPSWVTVVGSSITAVVPATFVGSFNFTVAATDLSGNRVSNAFVYNFYSYSLSSTAGSVNEGGSFTVTLTTSAPDGSSIPYTITGVSSADIGGASLTGNFVIAGGTASAAFSVFADFTTEGVETFTLSLNNILPAVSVNVTINDTSQSPRILTVSPAVGGQTSIDIANAPLVLSSAGTWTVTIPAGGLLVGIKAWGAGGGGGGRDGGGGYAGAGGSGTYVTGSTTLSAGSYTVIVGGGGAGGYYGGGGSITSSGSNGGGQGNVGPAGASGVGGGGGGRTEIILSGTIIMCAGGGGGGNGQSGGSGGESNGNGGTYLSTTENGLGGSALAPAGDRGGYGGGGGGRTLGGGVGEQGGARGQSTAGSLANTSIVVSGTTTAGSGTVTPPANITDANYVAGKGYGGAPGAAGGYDGGLTGGDGLVILY